jgi:hypothetical protein
MLFIFFLLPLTPYTLKMWPVWSWKYSSPEVGRDFNLFVFIGSALAQPNQNKLIV